MPESPSKPPSPRRALLWTAFAAVAAAYLASLIAGRSYHPQTDAGSAGYYGLLTEALVSGQLSLKVPPDPRLATLANPYLSYQGIPRLHDATYYHGKYYIYFGVAPVLLFFGPWRLLTGTYLAEGAGTLAFGFVGFGLGLLILRAWLRQCAARPGPGWLALGILGWGLGTYAYAIAQASNFYAVPILCAFMLVMAALYASLRSLLSPRPARAAGWLALGSAAWGLAVGSRPHYVFSLPLLALPTACLLWRQRGAWARGSRLRLVAAVLTPAAAVGAFLAWYNYARFGSVAEFGFHYQFTGGDQRFIQMWNPALILPNLQAYLLHDGAYTIYFPFINQTSLMQGAFAFSPFAALGLAFPLTLLVRPLRQSPVWVCLGLMALGAALIHVLALSILPIGVDRYNVDFDPEFSLAAGGTAACLFASSASWGRLRRLALRAALALLLVVSILKCSFLAAAHLPNPQLVRRLAVIGNYPVALVQQALGGIRGPIKLEVSFAHLKVGESNSLIETARGRDGLFVQRLDAQTARLGFVHLGNMPLYGVPFPLSREGHQTVIADLGCLYPPDTHRCFFGWKKAVVDALQSQVNASVDGQPVLAAHSNFYPTDPFMVQIGDVAPDGLALRPFPGPIYKVSHLHLPSEAAFAVAGWHGDVRLHFKFPAFSFTRTEPLLSTGATENADMIYVTYLGKGLARFGHDSANGGSEESVAVTFDPAVEHTLDVGLGSLEAAPGTTPSDDPGLRLAFDGKLLVSMSRRSHPSQPYQVVFGFNSGKLSTAQEAFSGAYLRPEHIVFPKYDPENLRGIGPVETALRFVPMPSGINEPLVVSGLAGKGDIIYVRYLDPRHALIGLDHWAVGARQSEPFELVPNAVYTLRVSSATYLPPAGDPRWGRTPLAEQHRLLGAIRVELNGREVLVAPWPGYPADDGQIFIGRNPIGGSTTGPAFSGKVLESRRDPVASATRGADTAGTARP